MVSVATSTRGKLFNIYVFIFATISVLLLVSIRLQFKLFFAASLPLSKDSIFVVSLQGSPNSDERNQGRLDNFQKAWQKQCGSNNPIEINVCPGVVDERRGYGLTRSWLNCLQKARQWDLDYTIVLEDDARLFDDHRETSLDFCQPSKRQSKIWAHLPKDTFIAFLGGHSWEYVTTNDEKEQQTAQDHKSNKFLETSFSYGTYGFAVPRQSLDLLLETIQDDLENGFVDEEHGGIRQTDYLSPEKSWYRQARQTGQKMYAIHPLAIWHDGGFSNTWKTDRGSITGEEKDDDNEDGDAGQAIRGVATADKTLRG